MQFEQFKDGTRKDLPNQSIDTGMGIERVAALLQGTNDNYETDLMRALIEASAEATGSKSDGDNSNHHRVIACLLYTSPSPRDLSTSRMPSSA